MKKKLISMLLLVTMVVTSFSFTGCGDEDNEVKKDKDGNKVFTAFFAVPGNEISENNRIRKKIAEKTGASVDMTWLAGQSSSEACGTLIASQEYPDFIDGSDGTQSLIDAGALIPIDEYWDDYPNIKNYFDEKNWAKLRQDDGHIYIIPQFDNINKEDTQTFNNDEAFWIQTKVLAWDNYPKIKTLDQYFDLIERYIEANPKMEDGTDYIGYEILCDDWKYYCLENPPMFLDGYPNDGCCIMDADTITAKDYNTTPTAKKYFNKLNEEFKKDIIDKEAFTLSYDQYMEKLSSGRVLGMVDQYWNFRTAEDTLKQQGMYDAEYIPLGITMDESIQPRYHSNPAISNANGLGITTACKDVKGALQFVNDLLDPDIMTLRFWGEEGVDYQVGEDGVFSRNEQQRADQANPAWKTDNWCDYSYFPFIGGKSLKDDKNSYSPEQQPDEYYATLSEPKKACLDAYGAKTILQMMDKPQENSNWFPLWSFTNAWTADKEYGLVKVNMDELKHQWLPKVVMADDFDSEWDNYMKEYSSKIDIDCYLDAITTEARKRNDEAIKASKGETTKTEDAEAEDTKAE